MPRLIAGEWGGRQIRAPEGREVRPTSDRVRESWMSILQPHLPGARVLDLFAGSGALGLECLSRGAREAVFVERSGRTLRILEANVASLGAESRCRVIRGDVFQVVGPAREASFAFDLALADPPYERGLAPRLLRCFLQAPFAGELWIEHARREPLPEVEGARSRRYGDTVVTRIPGPESPGAHHAPGRAADPILPPSEEPDR